MIRPDSKRAGPFLGTRNLRQPAFLLLLYGVEMPVLDWMDCYI